MQIKDFLKNTIKGVLYALCITIVLVLIFSIATTRVEFTDTVERICFVTMTCLALVIGAVIAAKSHGSKGWMLGLAVGTIYYIAVYLLAMLFGESGKLTIYEFYRLLMAMGTGTLAGMLGINL